MSRHRHEVAKLNLTSLIDVFTILVFFLLVNSANPEVLSTPKQIELPASVVEDKPRETVVVFVSPTEITVQGKPVAQVADVLAMKGDDIPAIRVQLEQASQSVIGMKTKLAAESNEVTILADKTVPFTVIKRVMSTCTSQGYGRISLAVVQKASEMAQL
jgi:biopolymer transport protein ExbD